MRRALFDFRKIPKEQQGLILALLFFWSILSYLLISHFVVGSVIVVGDSMDPTMIDGTELLLNRWVYHFSKPQRFDVVAIQLPTIRELMVKRVIALPGEELQLLDGKVRINKKALDEPYLSRSLPTTSVALSNGVFRVAPNCYFVLGDNRTNSADSRVFGAVDRSAIVGRVSSYHVSRFM